MTHHPDRRVGLVGTDDTKVAMFASELEQHGRQITVFSAHDPFVQDASDVDGFVIVANLSAEPCPAEHLTLQAWNDTVRTVLTDTFQLIQAAGEALMDSGGGTIVVIAGIESRSGIAGLSHVCAGAAGIEGLVRTAAIEWGQAGVRINLVLVGPPADDTSDVATTDLVSDRTPLGKPATPAAAAAAARYLLSAEATHVTGSALTVDGGLSAGMITRWNGRDYASTALLARGVYAELR